MNSASECQESELNASSALCASDIPVFLRTCWFEAFATHINGGGEAVWIPVSDAAHSPALALLRYEQKLLGLPVCHLNSMSNFYSPMYGVTNSHIDEVVTLCQQEAHFTQADCINLLPLTSGQAKVWTNALQKIGFVCHQYDHSVNWFQDNIQSVEHYWAGRPSRLCNTLKRKKDKLQREGGYSAKILSSGDHNELMQGLIDYHQVYFHSWKKNEPWPAFIDAIANMQWQTGELRLGLMYHHDTPVAAQLWFVNGRTAYIYKLAHRSDYSAQSVGTVLSAKMFDWVIEQDKVSRIDFLTGDDPYKQDWMDTRQPLLGIQACNRRRVAGQAKALVNKISTLSKHVKPNNKQPD